MDHFVEASRRIGVPAVEIDADSYVKLLEDAWFVDVTVKTNSVRTSKTREEATGSEGRRECGS